MKQCLGLINMIDRYFKLKKIIIDNRLPKTYLPKIHDAKYTAGMIDRYFVQEAGNDLAPIFEVDKKTYSNILNTNYHKRVSLKWRIIGPLEDKKEGGTYYPSVITSNRKAIDEAAKTMPAIRYHLVNLKQFWKSE